ncbi:acetylglutamate kinase [Eubacterium coprostanoligenes]|uniref:acetylglutamate kinase n=1 Tax=Eubacterium coprostanoligenes TaxID=290054 RepID=UPI002353A71B|nr:acetylglutamate kinase [Eubacterium coprostanoligenes]MCI6354152.1 acetylglutamate kinase [Eubacterium coprostanoligenes]MCI6361801.1 acetylglutamate kinase [Eubacterium coprostanoligenes]
MNTEIDNESKAHIIAEALPHIQKYRKKTIVVKYGGNAMINNELKEAVMHDLVLLTTVGIKVVLVHGGGPEINKTLSKIGVESKFVDGLRVTDQETIDVVQMVLAGKVNKDLVCQIGNLGGHAIGLSGMDGNMIKCKPLDDKHGFVGEIIKTNMDVIKEVLENNFIPVISTIGYDEQGNCYNINADTVAAQIAGDLKAEALISMTDIVGLLRDINDESTIIQKVFISDIPALIADGIIKGGMIPKIDSMTQAIRNGCTKAFIIDGRVPHSILMELLTDEGMGTMFKGR